MDQALEERLGTMTEGDVFRAWIPGCSTGQDAFSLAIVLQEVVAKIRRRITFRLFATDINLEALEFARRARYPATIARDVSPDRLRTFFTEEHGGYRLCSWVRETALFGEQNIITDPPISTVHLVLCRNLLIHLDDAERRRALSIFHQALQPRGLLFTATGEATDSSKVFSSLDRQHPIYARVDTARPASPWSRCALGAAARRANAATAVVAAGRRPLTATAAAEPRPGDTSVVREVRRRMRSTRTRTLPDIQVPNDELRSAIEELVNTNEQLETSREEIYALNEELSAVNSALENQIESLRGTNDDLNNLLRTADIAAIIVTRGLEIVHFTERIVSSLPLRSTDIGRSLGDIAQAREYESLLDDAREVVQTLETKEVCSTVDGGSSVLVRSSPYRTAENVIPGHIIITFTEVGDLLRRLKDHL